MQPIITGQHSIEQDRQNIARRLESYHLLRRQVHAEIEHGILRMMEESGHALFHPELCFQELPTEENPIHDEAQPSKP